MTNYQNLFSICFGHFMYSTIKHLTVEATVSNNIQVFQLYVSKDICNYFDTAGEKQPTRALENNYKSIKRKSRSYASTRPPAHTHEHGDTQANRMLTLSDKTLWNIKTRC